MPEGRWRRSPSTARSPAADRLCDGASWTIATAFWMRLYLFSVLQTNASEFAVRAGAFYTRALRILFKSFREQPRAQVKDQTKHIVADL